MIKLLSSIERYRVHVIVDNMTSYTSIYDSLPNGPPSVKE